MPVGGGLPISGHHGQDTITSTVIGATPHVVEPGLAIAPQHAIAPTKPVTIKPTSPAKPIVPPSKQPIVRGTNPTVPTPPRVTTPISRPIKKSPTKTVTNPGHKQQTGPRTAPGGPSAEPTLPEQLGPQESTVPAIVNTQPSDSSSSGSSSSPALLIGLVVVAGVAIYWFVRHGHHAGGGEHHKAAHKSEHHGEHHRPAVA